MSTQIVATKVVGYHKPVHFCTACTVIMHSTLIVDACNSAYVLTKNSFHKASIIIETKITCNIQKKMYKSMLIRNKWIFLCDYDLYNKPTHTFYEKLLLQKNTCCKLILLGVVSHIYLHL